MVSFPSLYHAFSGFSYAGIATWEIYTATKYTNVFDMNDLARCFTITMSIMNILLAIGSLYISIDQCKKDHPKSGRVSVNAATGISIWGIFMYFRFSSSIMNVYRTILLAETCLFFIRIGLATMFICSSKYCSGKSESNHVIDIDSA